jgi:hypothetical protein
MPRRPQPPSRRNAGRILACIIACLAALAAVGVFVSQTFFSRAQENSTKLGRSEPGARHWNDRIASVPWSVHIVEVERTHPGLGYYAGLATGKVLGISRVSDMARALPRELGRPVAAINGDFYERDNRTYAGDPRGLQIVNGELVSGTSTAALWFDADNTPHIDDVRDEFLVTWPGGQKTVFDLNQQRRPNTAVLYTPTYGDSTRAAGGRDFILEKAKDGPWLPLKPSERYQARVRDISQLGNAKIPPDAMVLSIGQQLLSKLPNVETGAVVEISTALRPELKGVATAIAGGPAIVKNGKPFTEDAVSGSSGGYSERSKYERHPRSAVGWNDKKFFFVTVDGRQPGLSVGMTLAELGEYMATKLKCTDGMNLDGGVSASLWMSGSTVSDPCQGERAVANSLILYRKATKE